MTFAHGAVFQIDRDAPDAILYLTSVDGFEITSDDIDVSDHQSTEGYMEYIAGLIDGGEVNIEGNFDAAEAVKIVTALRGRNNLSCSILLPTTPLYGYNFDGYSRNFKMGAVHDDKIPFSAVFKASGITLVGEVGTFAMSTIGDLLVDGDTKGLSDVGMTTGGTLGGIFYTE